MFNLSDKITSAVFASLNVGRDVFETFFEGTRNSSNLRLAYYPPCPEPEKSLGNGAHTDYTAISIICQEEQVTSLQVLKDGVFVNVPPVQGK